jgi:hypothetical protein
MTRNKERGSFLVSVPPRVDPSSLVSIPHRFSFRPLLVSISLHSSFQPPFPTPPRFDPFSFRSLLAFRFDPSSFLVSLNEEESKRGTREIETRRDRNEKRGGIETSEGRRNEWGSKRGKIETRGDRNEEGLGRRVETRNEERSKRGGIKTRSEDRNEQRGSKRNEEGPKQKRGGIEMRSED